VRRQLTAYVTYDEFSQLRTEAEERGISLSRYIKERLVQNTGRAGMAISDAKLAATEKKIIDAHRTAVSQVLKPIAQQLTTLLTMLDQFVLSVLIHAPEIPESQRKQALAAGERRHRGWRAEVEEILRRMEPAPPKRNPKTADGEQS
jgi:hypothetical protein